MSLAALSVGHAEAAAEVEVLDGMAGAAQLAHQVAHQREGMAERLQGR